MTLKKVQHRHQKLHPCSVIIRDEGSAKQNEEKMRVKASNQ